MAPALLTYTGVQSPANHTTTGLEYARLHAWPNPRLSGWACNLRPTSANPDYGASKGSLAIRCHHLLKTFWTGRGGWADKQLPDGSRICSPPLRRVVFDVSVTFLSQPCGNQLATGRRRAIGLLSVMSASAKPRLAGRQPSNRGGVPRVMTRLSSRHRLHGKRGSVMTGPPSPQENINRE